jgi:hypothetical protein
MMADLEARYLCEAGYARAAWRSPGSPERQVIPDKWLKGLLVAIAACGAIGLAMASRNDFGPRETTARMERMIEQIDRMSAIRPETAQAIARVISQPAYDCDQVACDQNLKARNMAVRFGLETSLAEKASAGAVEVASAMKPSDGIASSRAE